MLIFSFHNEIEEKMFLGIYFKLILSSSCLCNKLQKEQSFIYPTRFTEKKNKFSELNTTCFDTSAEK